MVDLGLKKAVLATLSPARRSKLDMIGSWDLRQCSVRAQRKFEWTDAYRDQVEIEYRRFLGLVAIDPLKSYGMAGDVDHLWHEHILNTPDYLRMCDEVFGMIVHHCPLPEDASDEDADSRYSDTTLPSLRETYVNGPSDIWPRTAASHGISRCCEHISQKIAA